MKKRGLLLALVFCTVLCLLTLASCGKKDGDATTSTEHEHVWVEGEKTAVTDCEGEIAYSCSVCGATKTEPYENHTWGEGTRLVALPTANGAGECERICTLCGKTGGNVPMTNEEYIARVNGLREQIDAFKTADFGGAAVTKTIADFNKAADKTYNAPPKNPIAAHPRVLFNASDLDGIRGALKEDRSRDAAARFFDAIASMPDGKLGEATLHEKGTYKYIPNCTYNYDDEMLKDIQALALDYQLTGNRISGYGAILAIENFILTLDIVDVKSDPERQYGAVMYTAACVYDWCYDLLTATEKLRIVSGIEHKIVNGKHMEMGFPPTKQYSVAGHGCEYQLMRDYLAFAIAVYDEYPGWWDFVGGRIYQDYVPVREEFYKAGMVPQGVSL